MMCSRPFRRGVAEFGCGQCTPCRLNRRRLWTARLMLEAHKHEHCRFVTLTYDKEHLPPGGVLLRRHSECKRLLSYDCGCMEGFLKRLRFALSPKKIRYYGVGEYGDISRRPHYHLALFGTDGDDAIRAAWKAGYVHIGTLTPDSAAYIVSYVVKGMTRSGDKRLDGLPPEFARMSLKPGIGADAMADFGRSILNEHGEYVGLVEGDVPVSFKANGRNYPIGRYLRRKLRRAVFMPEPEPVAVGELRSFRRMVDLREAGKNGWKAREEKRAQVALNARKKVEITNSRKGIGL